MNFDVLDLHAQIVLHQRHANGASAEVSRVAGGKLFLEPNDASKYDVLHRTLSLRMVLDNADGEGKPLEGSSAAINLHVRPRDAKALRKFAYALLALAEDL